VDGEKHASGTQFGTGIPNVRRCPASIPEWDPDADLVSRGAPIHNLVLETAVNGGADVIATFYLADLRDGAARFGIPVERPGEVLRRMRG
jgi:hypothetical protein